MADSAVKGKTKRKKKNVWPRDAAKKLAKAKSQGKDVSLPTNVKVGRPTKYDPKYGPMMAAWVKKTQLPFYCFAAQIGISEDTLYEWKKKHKEFSEHTKIAKAVGKCEMMSEALKGMKGKTKYWNATTFAIIMNNCYGFKREGRVDEDDEIDEMEF